MVVLISQMGKLSTDMLNHLLNVIKIGIVELSSRACPVNDGTKLPSREGQNA